MLLKRSTAANSKEPTKKRKHIAKRSMTYKSRLAKLNLKKFIDLKLNTMDVQLSREYKAGALQGMPGGHFHETQRDSGK